MNPSNGPRPGSADTKSPEKDFSFSALDALETSSSLEGDAVTSTGALAGKASDTSQADAYLAAKERALKRRRIIGFSLLGLAILIGVVLIFVLQSHQKAAETKNQDASKRFPTISIPLAELSKDSNATVINNQVLSVNGQLNVNNALVLAPGAKPTTAVAGQLFYDQTTNKLTYYDGTTFQTVADGNDIPVIPPAQSTSIGGATGTIGLGSGLSQAGNTLSNTGVLTLQGQAGNVTLTNGGGLVINGTTLSNSGVLSLAGQNGDIAIGSGLGFSGGQLKNTGIISAVGAGTITVTNDGNGNITIDGPGGGGGSGTVASLGGTIGRIAKFTGVQTIADSLLSESGTTVTVNGNLAVTGTLSLSTPLSVTDGGTGANTAAGARTSLGAAKNGANSDITSLSGLTTALSVAQGGTGVGTLATNGVIVGNGTSPLSAVVAGAAGQCLVSTAGAPTFAACPGAGGVSSLNGGTGALTLNNASLSGSAITISDASTAVKGIASFNSTNFTASSGAINTVQNINTSATPTFGQLSLTSSQATNPMLLVNNTNGAATGNLLDLQLNGSSKLSVAPTGNITTTGTISSGTINGQTISSTANFTGSVAVGTTLAVNTITPSSSLTIGATGQSFTLQGNASSKLTATNGANVTTVGFQNPTASVTYNFATAAAGAYNICTTAGNCVGVGGGVSTSGGTTNALAKFTGSQTIGDSIISDNGSTVTIGGTLAVNTLTPTAALTIGATGQNLTLQGANVSLSRTSGGITNSLVFANPASSNKTITLPNATGTVAVSASGPLSLDSLGNLSCPTCLTGGGGGGSGVSSLNGLSGALILQSSDAATFTNGGTTITVNDASSTVKGVAKFDPTNLTVTSGTVNTVQNISVTSTPTFAGLNLTTALTVGNGGTGATTAGGARTNLGAAASGANSDITSLSGLTTALSVAQGGTGVATTPTNGQILIGNGSGYSLNTLTAGTGINISNTAGSITISAPSAGSCSGCANTALSNLTGVAINTSLLPGTAGGANLGSSTLPFGQLSLAGTSSSPATNNFLITGASTGGVRTITLPDASGTIAVSASGNIALSANGDITFTGQLPVANGGTGANSASGARTNLGAAASGANSDITSLSGLTTALSVAQGGTGATSLTANGILLGNGTSAVTALTGSNGQCLVISGGVPVFTTCPGSGGSYVDLQASTPGTAQTGNFNITGTGIANILQGATFDTPSGTTTLNIGSTNATSISLNQDVIVAAGKTLSLSSALGSNTVLSVQASGDTFARFTAAADGTLKWGSGSATQDITLSRNGPNGLNLASNLQTTGLSVSNSLTLPTGIKLFVQPNNGTTVGVVVRANASQSNDLFQFQDSSNNVNASFNATGNTLTLGRIAGSGTVLPGNLIFSDGTTDTFGATLNTTTLSANRTIALPNESGTICLQNSANCGFLTGAAANGSYIQLQGTTPGTAQTGNFNITGTGIAGSLQAASVDRASAGTLAIGNTNATTVNVGTNNSGHTIGIGTGTGTQAITLGSTSGTSTTTIQGGDGGINFNQGTSSTGGYIFTANGGQTIFAMDYYGRTTHKALSTSIGSIFQIQNSVGSSLFGVNSNDDTTYVNGGGLSVSTGGIVNAGGLTFSGVNSINYTTPLGTNISTKINIPNYNPGAYNQIIALGLPSTADINSRAITIADARASAHQPTIGILSPNEADIAGFSWEGTNNTFSVKSTNDAIALQTGAGRILTVNGSTGTALTTLGNGSNIAGRLQLANATNNFMASIQASTTSADYITQLPTAIGTAGQCLYLASVSGSTQTLGYTTCGPGAAPTLQTVYDNSATANPQIQLSNANGGLKIRDASSSTIGNLFQIQNAAGSSTYFAVTASGLTESGTATIGGAANTTQVIIKANASQSLNTPLISLQTSGGTEMARITATNNGDFFAGYQAGSSLSGGSGGNVGVGSNSLAGITTGSYNTVVGSGAGANLVTGVDNALFGASAGNALTGNSNVAIGKSALNSVTSGGNNTAIGSSAGAVTGAGSSFNNNTFLGYNSGAGDTDTFATLATLQNATAIGYNSQVQASNTIALGGAGSNSQQVVIGSTMPTGTNIFGVSPVIYSTGTASQSGSTITGVGTTWNTANGVRVGMRFIFANGTDGGTITAVTNTTHLTVSTSQTVSSQKYRIHTVGFQITNTGDTYIRRTSTVAFQIQDANGTALLTADTSAGSVTNVGQTILGGNANQTQVIVKANASQSASNPLISLQSSGGSELARITADANNNFFAGYLAGITLAGGTDNNGVGTNVLGGITSGVGNVGMGTAALINVGTGSTNVGIGYGAGGSIGTGTNNIAIGKQALTSTGSSGIDNTIGIGYMAGSVSGGDGIFYNNIFLGMSSGSNGAFGGDTDGFVTIANLHNAGAIGYQTQVQASNTIVLGGIGSDAQKVVIGSTMATGSNLFGVSPVVYSTGTASQSTTTITGVGTSWSNANGVYVGQRFIFADGTDGGTITAITNTTHLTVSTSQTVASQNYRIHSVGFQITNTGDTYIQRTSTTAFSIQDAAGTNLLKADTSTGTITLGSSGSGNYITFTAAGGLQSFGTARPTKYISLSAEYAGAVLYGGDTGGANCSTNQNGTMTSGYDTSSSQQSYYNWTSSQATNQCFDVVVRVPLPSGFDGWAAAPSIQVKTDNASNSAYAIGIIKSDGSTYDTSYGSAYTSPGTLGTSWANMSTSSLDSSGYTAGSYMTIRVRMTAKNSANLQLGDIKLAYYSKY